MPSEPGIFEIMHTCRAMRKLKPDPVPEELLVRLITLPTRRHPARTRSRRATSWYVMRSSAAASPN